jgi:hypothetical protein
MNSHNAKANLVRASIAFLVGESSIRSVRNGLRSRTFMLLAEGSTGPVTRRELGANETVEVRDLATRSVQRVKAAEVSLYRHIMIFSGRTWRIMNIVG